ncbi:protein ACCUMULATION AND REPLICATION OF CHLOROPLASTS 3 isoform X2 [Carica papaya]|uniref:protein ACCUMULATION AND REPLICATION OF CHLOROPLASTS 3 isoform X2 n=1 Tax=Carica papaya TaxID=3649 RepID=UPI000B8CB688|nr:protein ACCUMULATION AND REPLICATION OF CHLOROPLASTS 3 isoform X2 [Carica papaya]
MQCHLIPQGLIFKKMPFSMELPIFSSTHSPASRVSLRPFVSTCVLYSSFLRYKKFGEKLSCSSRPPLRISMCVLKDCCSLSGDLKGDREVVEVIGIGSRKDAVIDFCLNSNFQSASLRFWNILVKDSLRVELHQRLNGKDVTAKIVEPSHFIQSCSKTVILVASAGYDLDHSAAIDILKTVRSANGLVVAIVLKPFSFEGRRRLDEVKDLAGKLQDHINFCIDVDTDKLLKKDLVTLDEALRTANNAVLLAINAVAVLPSGVQKQFLDANNNFKELKISDIVKILEGYKEAKVGFGVGHDIKASILQAIYDCPFIGAGIKDLNGIIICIFASPNLVENNNAQAVLETFRRITDYKGQIIISTIHEPNLEPNELITTVVILSCLQQEPPQEGRILSRLARHFPFFFNLLRRYHPQPNASKGNNMPKDVYPSAMINSKKSSEVESRIDLEGIAESFNNYSEELQAVSSDSYSDDYASSEADQSEVGLLESMKESFNFYDEITEGSPAFLREQAISWNLGPGDEIAQQWAKKREAESGDSPALDSLSIFSLPVGVRPSEELKDGFRIFAQCLEPITEDDVKAQRLVNSNKAMKDVYDTASTLLKGKYADTPKKQGNLSVRAASMLVRCASHSF